MQVLKWYKRKTASYPTDKVHVKDYRSFNDGMVSPTSLRALSIYDYSGLVLIICRPFSRAYTTRTHLWCRTSTPCPLYALR